MAFLNFLSWSSASLWIRSASADPFGAKAAISSAAPLDGAKAATLRDDGSLRRPPPQRLVGFFSVRLLLALVPRPCPLASFGLASPRPYPRALTKLMLGTARIRVGRVIQVALRVGERVAQIGHPASPRLFSASALPVSPSTRRLLPRRLGQLPMPPLLPFQLPDEIELGVLLVLEARRLCGQQSSMLASIRGAALGYGRGRVWASLGCANNSS